MNTLFVENTPDVDAWLARRRELGQDRRDEVWESVYHVAPGEHARNVTVVMALVHLTYVRARSAGLTPCGPCNVGTPGAYRIPDAGYYPGGPRALPHDSGDRRRGAVPERRDLRDVRLLRRPRRRRAVGGRPVGALRAGLAARQQGRLHRDGTQRLLDLDAAAIERDLDWPGG